MWNSKRNFNKKQCIFPRSRLRFTQNSGSKVDTAPPFSWSSPRCSKCTRGSRPARVAASAPAPAPARGLRPCAGRALGLGRIPGLQNPRATGGGNKDGPCQPLSGFLTMWRPHCQAGIGDMSPIPYDQNLLVSVAKSAVFRGKGRGRITFRPQKRKGTNARTFSIWKGV